ncbi:MAG: leucine-rich repeat protein [Bacteroidales bacterium]|nr:leucine-rich repeat protein [Bacteroidales bacterium]MDD6668274.1 leucine-rich repeat protein [Bacteroidales bacterium]
MEFHLFVPSIRLQDGKPVVGLSGFGSLKNLDGIFFPEKCHVKYICDNCFEYCQMLGTPEVLNLPETVETIGHYAFYGCTGLRSVNLSSNLKSIGRSAFELCKSLKSITLPKSLKVIYEYAFRNCANFDNWGNFIGGGLESVVFEDGVDFYTTNGSYCFYNHVFWGCANLSSVKLPKGTPGRFIIPMGTFGYCGKLKSIEFPENTRRIEQMAFYRSGLESLDLTTIEGEHFLQGYYTFAACENLKTIKANGKLRFDGLYIFQDCKALETATFTGSGDDYTEMSPDIFKYCDNLKSVEFYRLKGTGLDNEMDSVFTGCKSLEKVTSTCEPELRKIGYSCFDGCESLKTVTLPKEKAFVVSETAFRGCAALQSLDLANVTTIGIKAFTGCGALASINFNTLSDNLPTVANENAFDEWHYANTAIKVPDPKYSEFAADAFWSKFLQLQHPSLFAYTAVPGGYSVSKSQYALEEDFTGMLEIPGQHESADVVAIAESAFQGVTGITGVTLPEGLTSIGSNAFAGCTNIGTVINKAAMPLSGGVCPESIFGSETYSNSNLYVPFGSLDAYSAFSPWKNFDNRIKQGFGERTLSTPQFSLKSGEFNKPFELTLTTPNNVGTIYYYIVSESENKNDVHTVLPYSAPININSTCKVVAYVTDGTNCSESGSFECTYVIIGTENGLDKVLAANADDWYQINTNLYGHYFDGTYLYASTIGNSGSSKNTVNEDKKSEAGSDIESEFIQEDWVAISGLTADYVGQEIESGNMANVISNDAYPVITFPESVTGNISSDINFNTYRVQNFNINAESAVVSNIWLVAPQPAEYCTVAGYMDAAKINTDEGYLVLQSAKDATTLEDETVIEPLAMKVYYNAASITLGVDGWYAFTGIVSKDGDGLKFTALEVEDIPAGVKDVNAGNARIFAANGNINVTSEAKAGITVYSTSGQLVASLEASSATIAVSPGFYIVKVGNRVKKLAVY